MFRSMVSLVLLPCVLLTQSALVCHCHDINTLAGHDFQPHIHIPFGCTSQEEDLCQPQSDPDHFADKANASDPPPPEHDSDAIFVQPNNATIGERSKQITQVLLSIGWNTSVGWLISSRDPSAALSVFHGHPPPCLISVCPLYIQHLILLI